MCYYSISPQGKINGIPDFSTRISDATKIIHPMQGCPGLIRNTGLESRTKKIGDGTGIRELRTEFNRQL